MCGIVGIVSSDPVSQELYDALLVLQHRGQDSAGIVTSHDQRCHSYKQAGLVSEVFDEHHLQGTPREYGNRPCSLSDCRYK